LLPLPKLRGMLLLLHPIRTDNACYICNYNSISAEVITDTEVVVLVAREIGGGPTDSGGTQYVGFTLYLFTNLWSVDPRGSASNSEGVRGIVYFH
jgi:hypothetical protein